MEKEEYLDDAEFDLVYNKFEEFWGENKEKVNAVRLNNIKNIKINNK